MQLAGVNVSLVLECRVSWLCGLVLPWTVIFLYLNNYGKAQLDEEVRLGCIPFLYLLQFTSVLWDHLLPGVDFLELFVKVSMVLLWIHNLLGLLHFPLSHQNFQVLQLIACNFSSSLHVIWDSHGLSVVSLLLLKIVGCLWFLCRKRNCLSQLFQGYRSMLRDFLLSYSLWPYEAVSVWVFSSFSLFPHFCCGFCPFVSFSAPSFAGSGCGP